MSAPVLVWPDMRAEVVALKESITGIPCFSIRLTGVGDTPVYLDLPEYLHKRYPCPEALFREVAARINRGAE